MLCFSVCLDGEICNLSHRLLRDMYWTFPAVRVPNVNGVVTMQY